MPFRPNRFTPGRPAARLVALAALCALLSACGSVAFQSAPSPSPEPSEPPTEVPVEPTTVPATPVPTPAYDFLASSPLVGSPQDTPEGTFELYLRDAISQAVQLQHKRADIRIHYDDPEILEQDLGGLVVDVDLIEDRSTFTYATDADISATYEVDVDILLTYGDGSTRPSQCNWTATLEKIDETWYVINPSDLPIFVNCTN